MDPTQNGEPVPQRRIQVQENVHPPPPPPKCPRCDSSNTKFCYYNNYSVTQPRYLCKGCRRYWTQGGTLRNVPIGGGTRRNKRPRFSLPSTSTNEIVTRSQTIPMASMGMGMGLRPSSDMGTYSNYNNINYLYTGGASYAAMQGINQPPMGGNMSHLHGMTLPPWRPFQSPQQLSNGGFQLWGQRLRGGASAGSRGGSDQLDSSFNPNRFPPSNYQGFGPSQ